VNQSIDTDLRHPALYDNVTGLPTTLLTRELLQRWITLAQRSDRIVAVLDLKIDQGDETDRINTAEAVSRHLSSVSETIQSTIRHSDFSGIDDDGAFIVTFGNLFSPGDANKVVTRLVRELRKRDTVESGKPKLAIGVSLYPVDGTDADALLNSARKARDLVALGNTVFEFASPQISQSIVEHTVLEERLLQALDTGEVKINYRPNYGLASKRIESIEALVYWQHPEFGVISPGALVALSEDLGLSIKVGTFVLEQAVADYREWSRNLDKSIELLIYAPAPSFIDRRFVSIVQSILTGSSVAPHSLSLGLSESSILRSPEKSADVLTAFADIGIRLSVFGFGAGHSSLAGLILYPIHSLTLDSTLVRNGLSDKRALLMMETAMAAADKLDLAVTASGVQTEEQFEWLRSLGCSRAQGPLFGSPISAEKISELLEAGDK